MKLFIGIFPPKEIRDIMRDDLSLIKKRFKNYFNYSQVDQLHFTIKYLGSEVSEESSEVVMEYLKKYLTNLEEVEIELGSLNFGFKHQYRPTILKYDVYESRKLIELYNTVNDVIRETGLDDVIRYKEKPDYHITLARARITAPKHIKRDVAEFLKGFQSDAEGKTIKLEELVIVSSDETKDGARYKIIYKQKI